MSGRGYYDPAKIRAGSTRTPRCPLSLDGWARCNDSLDLHYLHGGVASCSWRLVRGSWRLVGSIKDRQLCARCVALRPQGVA